METQTHTPDGFVLKQGYTVGRHIKADQVFAKRTPLMPDATDKSLLVKWDGTPGSAVALAPFEKKATAADELRPVWVSGVYRVSEISWPDGLTDAKKRAAFQGSALAVDDE